MFFLKGDVRRKDNEFKENADAGKNQNFCDNPHI